MNTHQDNTIRCKACGDMLKTPVKNTVKAIINTHI